MSITTIQLGQCGNQLGLSFFENLYAEALNGPPAIAYSILNTFFTERPSSYTAKAVLIDMEPKVVNACLSKPKDWHYDKSSVFCKQEGSGNNWAYGYKVHGSKWNDTMINKVRRELEKTDVNAGMLVYLSLAGGTGSGVGASLSESLRAEFDLPLINVAVWPYSFGEVILQNYNTALTVSHLIQAVDGMVVFENDWLHYTTVNCRGIPKPDFSHMNALCASVLAGCFAPTVSGNSTYSQYGQSPYSYILRQLCSSPGFPFVNIVSTPIIADASMDFSNDTWPTLVKRTAQMQVSGSQEPHINWHANHVKTLSSVAVLRGREVATADTYPLSIIQNGRGIFPYSELRTEVQFGKHERSMNMMSNSQAIVNNLDILIEKTFRMSQSGAYLHHYNKFGIENQHLFEVTFPVLEQVLHNYRSLG